MSDLILRPARRDEIPYLARLQNAAMAKSIMHRYMVPNQDTDPKVAEGYYNWTLLRQRSRMVTPEIRYMVAEDPTTGEVAGLSVWFAQGDCPLKKKWTDESPKWLAIERALLDVEGKYHRYFTDTVVDWQYLKSFYEAVETTSKRTPPCLHLWVLVVDPKFQGRRVGNTLLDWGKRLAAEQRLPLVLESLVESTGFYDKMDMKVVDGVSILEGTSKSIRMPVYAWEYKEGAFIEDDGTGSGKLKWKDGMLEKTKKI
jgi:GNAT superfamily N-acetyltransferase